MRRNLILVILLSLNIINESLAFTIKVGASRAWPISNRMEVNASKSKYAVLQIYDLDSTLLTRISNLQVDVAVIPLPLYKNVFERQSQLSKFVIGSVVGNEDIGILSLRGCVLSGGKLIYDTYYSDGFSPEYNWMAKNKKNKINIKKMSNYKIFQLMESGNFNCRAAVVGSPRLLSKIKNPEQFKFEKIGQMPFLLLIEEHFFKNRFNELKEIKKELFANDPIGAPVPSKFEEIRKLVFDYNFSGTKFQLERLNEIIRPF